MEINREDIDPWNAKNQILNEKHADIFYIQTHTLKPSYS